MKRIILSSGVCMIVLLSASVYVLMAQHGTEFLAHGGGVNGYRSKRIPERETAEVAPSVLEQIVGVYRVSPDFCLTVTRDGNRLFAQGTGQPRHELFPISDSRFFLKTVPAEISFVRDRAGQVVRSVVHTGLQDEVGKKIR
jgi:hypothetical protein